MKAVYFDEHGGPEVLKYGDLPDPIAGEGEVVADIHAASINGADWKVRATGSSVASRSCLPQWRRSGSSPFFV